MLNIQCPSCKKVHQAPESMMGQQVQCKDCGSTFTVPHNAPPVATAPVTTPPAAVLGGGPGKPSLLGSSGGGLAKLLFLAGLVLIVFSRGGSGVVQKGIAHSKAKLDSAQTEFRQDWEDKIVDETDSQRQRGLQKEMSDEQEKLEKGKWRDMRRDAASAETNAVLWQYRLEWLFTIGSVVLAGGAAILSLTGSKTDRIVSLIVLGIIVISFFGGLGFMFQGR